MELSGFNIRNAPEQMADAEFTKKCQEKYDHFTKMRSIVIDAALRIEHTLSIVILHFLVGTDYSRHNLLREFIIDAEFCTFMQKRKMLSMIFEMLPDISQILSPEEGKDLRRRLNDLILNRDMFAHGVIFIDAHPDNVIIEYYRGGKKEIKINSEIVSDIIKSADVIEEKLHTLNEYFRENWLEIEKILTKRYSELGPPPAAPVPVAELERYKYNIS